MAYVVWDPSLSEPRSDAPLADFDPTPRGHFIYDPLPSEPDFDFTAVLAPAVWAGAFPSSVWQGELVAGQWSAILGA